MGIFTSNTDAVDYAQALKKIEHHIEQQKGDQIDSAAGIAEKDENLSDNDELYNQAIDDEGNTINICSQQSQAACGSEFEREYNEVISTMSTICRHLVWNNDSNHKDKRVKIDEDQIFELCPRIWSLANEYQAAS
jgi:hypothetical protein